MKWWERFWGFRRPCLTEEDDPVPARIWDNEDDAIFDELSDEVFDAWEGDLEKRRIT